MYFNKNKKIKKIKNKKVENNKKLILTNKNLELETNKKKINLLYHHYKNNLNNINFGDGLSIFITEQLINKDEYEIVYNEEETNGLINLICIGSYIQAAYDNTFIYGSGIRTIENIEKGHNYKNLNVYAVRGPLTKKYLEKKNINVPNVLGDPALLLSLFYKPEVDNGLKEKIGIIPHKSNFKYYDDINKIDLQKYVLINPKDKWENVINKICSCKYILSSSLHGLICADTYNIPNLWLDEYKIEEGDFKFRDYFESQNRKYIKISSIQEFDQKLLYKGGNKLDLNKLLNAFPFK